MKEPFFVMLHNQKSTKLIPLMGGVNGDELAMYRTFLQAEDAAESNLIGAAFGYEIFEAGCGVPTPGSAE